jgi:hypothetical protein
MDGEWATGERGDVLHGCTGEVRFDGCFVGLIKRKGIGVMWQLELRIRR